MKVRTLGPVLMMVLGGIITTSPLLQSSAGAGDVDPCLEQTSDAGAAVGSVQPDGCCPDVGIAAAPGVVDPDCCAIAVPVGVVEPDPCCDLVVNVANRQRNVDPECCPTEQLDGFVDPCLPPDTIPDTIPDTTPPTTQVSGGGGQIPETGSTSTGAVLGGGLLIGMGAALLLLGRRTSSKAPVA